MSTQAVTGYFAFLLRALAGFGAYLMLRNRFSWASPSPIVSPECCSGTSAGES